jgi:cyclic lactone autoinducer peptide
MNQTMARYVSKILEIIAGTFVRTASSVWNHRPEVPQELLKKK